MDQFALEGRQLGGGSAASAFQIMSSLEEYIYFPSTPSDVGPKELAAV